MVGRLVRRLPWAAPTPVDLPECYRDYKDPCVVWHDGRWQLFATGGSRGPRYDVVQAAADSLFGPWRWLGSVALNGANGPSVCAPGVISDGDLLHLFIQQAFNMLGSSIMHFVSRDGGRNFFRRPDALPAEPGTSQAGLYDAHPVRIDDGRYLVYSSTSVVGQSELHWARDTGGHWAGPWQRLGALMRETDLPWHNQPEDPDYEWGLEGGQLLGLPDGRVLLNAVGFASGLPRGQRQRVFFALADGVAGPYRQLGPILPPGQLQVTGENGHASAAVHEDILHLVYQHRATVGRRWRLSATHLPLDALNDL